MFASLSLSLSISHLATQHDLPPLIIRINEHLPSNSDLIPRPLTAPSHWPIRQRDGESLCPLGPHAREQLRHLVGLVHALELGWADPAMRPGQALKQAKA